MADPVGRQSQKRLVELTWIILLEMSRSYLTDQQIPRENWYYAISHSTYMINLCPGKLFCCLMTPHEIVYGVKPDSWSLLTIFSVGYLYQKKDGAATRSTTKSKTLAGIDIFRVTNSNEIQFYNPVIRSFYTTRDCNIDMECHKNTHFCLT